MDLQRASTLSFILSLCFLFTGASSFIKFANPDRRNEFPDRVVVSESKIFRWSAAWPTDIRLEFVNTTLLSLLFQCHVEKLHHDDYLKEASFCFGKNISPENRCRTLGQDVKNATLHLGRARVHLNFDPQIGINASIDKISHKIQIAPLDVFCRLTNRRGSVQSNRVFVLDLRKMLTNDTTAMDSVELSPNSATVIKCLDENISLERYLNLTDQPTVPFPFRWEVCKADNIEDCVQEKDRQSVLDIAKFEKWPVQIREDGELYLPFIPTEVVQQLQNKSLYCSYRSMPMVFVPLLLNMTDEDIAPTPARRLSGRATPRHVVLFNGRDFTKRLGCWVETSTPLSEVMWEFSHQKYEVVRLEKGSSNNGVTVAEDGSSITFKGPFSHNIEGLYSCVAVAGDKSVMSSFQVSVKRPPRISTSLPMEKIVISGNQANVTCEFEDAPWIRTSLEVCGRQLNLTSWAKVEKSRETLNAAFKDVLLSLEFNVSGVAQKVGQSVTYFSGPLKALHSKVKAEGPRDNSHQVTCIGHAPPFSVRKTVLLRVIPRPTIETDFPTETCRGNCTLVCNLANTSFYEKYGLTTEVRWTSKPIGSRAIEWNQWEVSGSNYLLQTEDAIKRKLIRCEVRLIDNNTRSILFAENTTTDLVLLKESDAFEDGAISGNNISTIVTATIFVILIIASATYFLVYRWKHRQRQSA